jgi:capsular polysaccharide transport system permease protein
MPLRRHLLGLLLVVLPTCCAAIYYGLIASDIYVSESRFVVRSPQRQQPTGVVGELLQSTGFSRSQDDTYSVRDFILSRDALKSLDDTLGVRQSYGSAAADLLNRFPGYRWDHSFEAFYRYYINQVGISYDPVSSITVLTVRAFNANDAYRINSRLLDMSEQLINELNDRSHRDLIAFAEQEVLRAGTRSQDASLALSAYRSKHAVFEPNRQAAIQLEGIARIQEALVQTDTELAQVKKLSPSNPQIAALTTRANALDGVIASQASKVTSAGDSLSARAPEFERLVLESTMADKQLGVALAELATARSDAVRKELYLERLVQPNVPDKAMQPRRLRAVVTVFLVGVIAWGTFNLLLASIREHSSI